MMLAELSIFAARDLLRSKQVVAAPMLADDSVQSAAQCSRFHSTLKPQTHGHCQPNLKQKKEKGKYLKLLLVLLMKHLIDNNKLVGAAGTSQPVDSPLCTDWTRGSSEAS